MLVSSLGALEAASSACAFSATGCTIVLTHDISLVSTSPIVLQSQGVVVVDGQGHTIDGAGAFPGFTVNSFSGTPTAAVFKNITFAQCVGQSEGGAIIAEGSAGTGKPSSLLVLSCSFVNCRAPNAGAISLKAGTVAMLTACEFVGNHATAAKVPPINRMSTLQSPPKSLSCPPTACPAPIPDLARARAARCRWHRTWHRL